MLDTRLALVLGKGGVGKTTVALVLAHRAVSRGRRVLFVALGRPQSELGAIVRALPASVEVLGIEGEAALSEYLRRRLRSALVHRWIVSQGLYRRFVRAAPGLADLMALGQVCDAERSAEWDAIVVDGPPTGQALECLRMPLAVMESFGPGLASREARRMLDGLREPARTRVFPVTIPEELPLSEVEELARGVRALGMAAGAIFVNRVRTSPVALARLPELRLAPSAPARAALRAARIEAAWSEMHAERLARLRARWSEPVITLPLLARDRLEEAELRALASGLEVA